MDQIAAQHLRSAEAPYGWGSERRFPAVSVMGANVYPEDIEGALYSKPELARLTKSHCLGLVDLEDGLRRARVSLEILGDITPGLLETFDQAVFEGLQSRSPDFREACKNRTELVLPLVDLFPEGEGPIADEDWRIKQRRWMAVSANV